MRLLADENFPKSIVDALRDHGHDVLGNRRARRRTALHQGVGDMKVVAATILQETA